MTENEEQGSESIVRPFVISDLPRLQEIRQAAFVPVFISLRQILGTASVYALADIETEQQQHLTDLCQEGSGNKILVAVRGDLLVGFVSYSVKPGTRFGEIGLNAVHPDFAGEGIGTRLYREALALMKREGVKVVEVSTGSDPSHEPARRAYKKAGFVEALSSVYLYREL